MDIVDIKYYYRTIGELRENKALGFEDPRGILKIISDDVKNTLLANPSLESDEDVCQIIALNGNRVIGSELSFPNRYIVDGEVRSCRGASTLFSDEEYRKYAIGTDLMINAANILPKQDNIVGGISQMAYPLYKAMRYACFSFKRFICLRKSRVVVEYVFKRKSIVTALVSRVFDFFLAIYRSVIFTGNRWRLRKFHFETMDNVPQEIEDLVFNDGKRFKECHDKKWFEWNLNHSFRSEGEKMKQLWVIKNQNNEIVGFFMIKIEYYKQASSRGFKNVTLGTVSEWGMQRGIKLSEFDVQMAAVRNMPSYIDGAEVATTDRRTIRRFKRHLLFPMGNANMAAFIQSIKEKTINDIDNWRIRIAAGDTLIN